MPTAHFTPAYWRNPELGNYLTCFFLTTLLCVQASSVRKHEGEEGWVLTFKKQNPTLKPPNVMIWKCYERLHTMDIRGLGSRIRKTWIEFGLLLGKIIFLAQASSWWTGKHIWTYHIDWLCRCCVIRQAKHWLQRVPVGSGQYMLSKITYLVPGFEDKQEYVQPWNIFLLKKIIIFN